MGGVARSSTGRWEECGIAARSREGKLVLVARDACRYRGPLRVGPTEEVARGAARQATGGLYLEMPRPVGRGAMVTWAQAPWWAEAQLSVLDSACARTVKGGGRVVVWWRGGARQDALVRGVPQALLAGGGRDRPAAPGLRGAAPLRSSTPYGLYNSSGRLGDVAPDQGGVDAPCLGEGAQLVMGNRLSPLLAR